MGDTNQYRYGDQPKNLGGTYRTLDGIDGRCDLGSGVVSQVSLRHHSTLTSSLDSP